MSKHHKKTGKSNKKRAALIKSKQLHGGSATGGGAQVSSSRQPGQKPAPKPAAAPAAKRLEELDLDEFLDGGFEQQAPQPLQARGNASSDDDDSFDSADGDESLDGFGSDDDAAAAGQAGSDGGDSAGSGSDDDDGDEAAAAAGGPEAEAIAGDNRQLRGALSRHRQQLEALRERDPDFYAYLQATDAGLLGFGEGEEDEDGELEDLDSDSDDEQQQQQPAKRQPAAGKAAAGKAAAAAAAAAEDDDDDEEQEEGEDESDEGGGAGAAPAAVQVTSSSVDGWCKAALDSASLGAMMQLAKAYRVACHYGDSEQQMSSTLSIGSAAVFNKVLLFMLTEADGIFRRMLGLQPDALASPAAGATEGLLLAEQVVKAPRWKKVEPLVRSYLGNSLHLLAAMTQPAMTAFILRRLRPSVALLAAAPRLTKKLLKLGLELFGSGDNAPRLQALLLVRQMGLVLPPPALQTVLRGAYRAYASNAKFVSPATLPALGFMAAGVVELSSLDLGVTYEVCFVAVRELAVLLRNALAAKTQDAHKEVYCWQTLNCLELWGKVLCAAAPRGGLQPLVYPLVQLLLGAARLVPTPRYFPIRLRLVRAANRLAQAAEVYVPVAPLLLEVLHWSELHKTPVGGASAAPDLLLLLRLSKAQLKTAALQEEVLQQVLELLADHLTQWATSVSFPEVAHLPLVALRAFTKHSTVERFRRSARQLVAAVEANITYVGNARDAVTFAPQDLAAASRFLASPQDAAKSPLVQFTQQLLQKAQARMAMRAAQQVQPGSGRADAGGQRKRSRQADESDSDELEQQDGGSSEEEEDDDDEAGADEMPQIAQQLMRQRNKQQQGGKQLKAAAAAAASRGAAAAGDDDGDDDEDQVGAYSLSDEEDDE